jgi:hypothetical protein
MPNVNDDGRTHASFIETYPGTAFTEVRFWPYDGGRSRQTLRTAINIIQNNIFGKIVPCNTYFSSLPGGRTFDAVWSDPTFWIDWDPRPTANFLAFTATSRRMEVTVSERCLAQGAWVTCASIVHEMAHLNGAPGADGSGSSAAERSLLFCGLRAHFHPGVIGDQKDYTNIQSRNRYT